MADELEWLDGSEDLFTSEGDPGLNACADFVQGDGVAYAIGYRMAAEHLFESYVLPKGTHDAILLPIAFLWRQYLELQLKHLIDLGRRIYEDKEGYPAEHNLQKLWTEARVYLEKDEPGAPEIPIADRLIAQFAQIDPGSFDFRYPLDRTRTRKTLDRVPPLVNLGRLHSGMIRLANLLDGAGDSFAAERDAAHEWMDSADGY